MIRDYYTPVEIDYFKRVAKQRRKVDPTLTQAQALDRVAQEHNWVNWSLLMKHSRQPVRDPVVVSVQEYPGGDYGVFIVEIRFEADTRTGLTPPAWFWLPDADNWLFRSAEPHGHYAKPYLDFQASRPRGVFVDGAWRAILSTNGIQRADARQHVEATMPALLAELKAKAVQSAVQHQLAQQPTDGGRFRLFFTMPNASGNASLEERGYATLEEAKDAELPDGCVKISIPTLGGYWQYQIPFGWSGPF